MEVHHVGYLVKSISEAITEFEKLGFVLENKEQEYVRDDIRKIHISFLLNGDYRVELVSPIDKESPIYGLMKRYKNSPYHICYCSYNLEKDLRKLEDNGWSVFQAPEVAPAISGRTVVFLMNSAIGMIELVDWSGN